MKPSRIGKQSALFRAGRQHLSLLGANYHLNIFIYDPIAPDPDGIITQGEGNTTARTIQVYQGEKLNESALLQLFKEVISNNRRGGWRKLVQSG